MPKTVDHDERRVLIAEAVVRVAAREGLHAVTMRSTAAEAGVSLRLVQYYFGTKSELIHGTLKHLERQSADRWTQRLAGEVDGSPRAFLETFVDEALPSNEASRAFHRTWTAYAVLAMTDRELAAAPFVAGPNSRERELADVLRRAATEGDLEPGRDPDLEAARLLTLVHGLGTSVLVGQRTAGAAADVLRYHFDELFPATEAV